MIWDRVRAHEDAIAQFRRSIGRGRLSHGYLFIGPSGIGKQLFAQTMAQCLLCENIPDDQLEACGECGPCKQMAASTHPDFIEIACPEGKKELPIELIAGSRDKRGKEGLCHELSLRPMEGDRKIAIIDDADMMNADSANAFLKTLEEPPPNSLLILIAENLDAVLPTIRSRCQLLRFGALGTDDVGELLVENEFTTDAGDAAAVAAMSDGSLQTGAQLLNPALRNLRERLYVFLSEPDMEPLDAAKTLTSGLDEIGGDTHEQRRGAGWLIRFAQEFYRQAVLVLSGESQTGQGIPTEVQHFARRLQSRGLAGTELAMDLFDRCVLAENHIDWNVNPGKAIESLFDDLARTSRSRSAKLV